MTEILYSFPSNSAEDTMYFGLGLGIFALCCVLFIISIRKKLQLLLMFSGFVGFLALGIAVFSYWKKTEKLPSVDLYEMGITTPEGTVPFDKIRKIDFMKQEQFSSYPIHQSGKRLAIDTANLIVIEEYSRKTHVISEFNYPVDSIYAQLRILVEAYKKKNENSQQ